MTGLCACGCRARVKLKNNRGKRHGIKFAPGHNWQNHGGGRKRGPAETMSLQQRKEWKRRITPKYRRKLEAEAAVAKIGSLASLRAANGGR